MTQASASLLKKSRPSAPRTRENRYRLSVERLEGRTLMAYDIGLAFGLGSTGIESANSVATDGSGNVLIAGSYSSASIDLDPGPGEYNLTNAGGNDGFVAKYDATGNLLWGVQLASTAGNYTGDVAVDGVGNVLIAGNFMGSIDIGAPGQPHVTLTNAGSGEGYLAKIDSAGNALWARTFGGSAEARFASGITADAAGNVYATGREGNRLFVAKYSPSGIEAWTKVVSGGTGQVYYGGTSYATGQSLAVDASSNVYVTGNYWGKIDFNPDPKKATSLTSAGRFPTYDAFILKLNANGTYVSAGSMGGRGYDAGLGIAVDTAGSLLVNGVFEPDFDQNADFDPGIGKFNLPKVNGGGGGFVAKLDPNLNLIWGRSGVGVRMALDVTGNVYTTGAFSGTFDADPGTGSFTLTAAGDMDSMVSKLSSAGSFVWAGALGGPGAYVNSESIAVDGQGNIFTAGYFRGTADFDLGAGTQFLASALGSSGNSTQDAFVSKLVPSSSSTSTAAAMDAALILFLTDDLILPNKRK